MNEIEILLKILIDIKPRKNGSYEFVQSYVVKETKPSPYFDPEKKPDFVFKKEIIIKQEKQFHNFPLNEQEEIIERATQAVIENFLNEYPKKFQPIFH